MKYFWNLMAIVLVVAGWVIFSSQAVVAQQPYVTIEQHSNAGDLRTHGYPTDYQQTLVVRLKEVHNVRLVDPQDNRILKIAEPDEPTTKVAYKTKLITDASECPTRYRFPTTKVDSFDSLPNLLDTPYVWYEMHKSAFPGKFIFPAQPFINTGATNTGEQYWGS